MTSIQRLETLITRTKEDAARHGSSLCHEQWHNGVTIRCHVVHGRTYFSTTMHGRISKAALVEWLTNNPPALTPAQKREAADEAFAAELAEDIARAEGPNPCHMVCLGPIDNPCHMVCEGVDPYAKPANYPSITDAFHTIAERLQARLFLAAKGTPVYTDLVEALDASGGLFESYCDEGLADAPAADYLDAHMLDGIPAWPESEEEEERQRQELSDRIDSDLRYASYYAQRAHFCSMDAVGALKVGRKDIAQQLRGMRDVYKHKARHLYNSVHVGSLFTPYGGY